MTGMTIRPNLPARRCRVAGARPPPRSPTRAPLDPSTPIEVTVVLRRRADGELGAEPGDLERCSVRARGGRARDRREPTPRRAASGSAARPRSSRPRSAPQLQQVTSQAPDGSRVTHRQRTGELSVPAAVGDRVIAVLGIDDRPQTRSQSRTAAADARSVSYTPLQLAETYNFPANTDGTGQAIAIIELGGGFGQSDLDTYFQASASPARRSRRSASTARRTSPARIRRAPTARCCSTSRSSARWRPARR